MSDASPALWPPLTPLAARIDAGRALRRDHPREGMSALTLTTRDPLGILETQNATRVPELVPLRIERMSASAFAFYRGTAAVMAADLAADPNSGILVGSCGDAHVANFGFYASPQRTLVFDLNDFDEAAWAPWEWDVKRLVTSIVLAAEAGGHPPDVARDACRDAVRAYARVMKANAEKSPVDRYFEHFELDGAVGKMDPETRSAMKSAIKDAERRTGERAAHKLTETAPDGRLRFIESPPTMVRAFSDQLAQVKELFEEYRATVPVDIGALLRGYELVDVARRVVGVGSVGTRCYLLLLQDGDRNALILQSKEAQPSVLLTSGSIRQPQQVTAYIARNAQGGRVVAMQRILQAVSDPFLGHVTGPRADYYLRQFHDSKGSIEAETLEAGPFQRHAQLCAAVLARAHSQSPNAATVSGYVGGGKVAAESITAWAFAYADVARQDYADFVAAHAHAAAEG
ncbi:DUF2252 domain-containing protein [Microbacterium thalassium]|uniref:Uncharacterized protein (DUF2252 family) n=1 Tax=Microbacterium thalassium TaxID=362649 RepID=A0A7X0KTV0_9MICO|nr:DUF2252 domain-containing protein [Microbacterium thalassium]MBB6390438.1 uncharacterized protein (DUF2252 family) [Microbacterium thalassium]GLK25547.1 hypothetical protein GCM10017607_28660 [Microbacterium thalassium]